MDNPLQNAVASAFTASLPLNEIIVLAGLIGLFVGDLLALSISQTPRACNPIAVALAGLAVAAVFALALLKLFE